MKIYSLIKPGIIGLSIMFYQFSNAQEDFFVLDAASNPGRVLEEINLPKPRIKGTVYLDETWKKGDVYLKSNYLLKDFPLKYDLENQILEIKTLQNIRVAGVNDVIKFDLESDLDSKKTFINCNQFEDEDGIPSIGFYEIIIDDQAKLLAKNDIEVSAANYRPALNAGRKNDEILKKVSYFIAVNNIAHPISPVSKKNYPIFKNKASLIKSFIKEHRLNFKDRNDLIKIVEYYNGLN